MKKDKIDFNRNLVSCSLLSFFSFHENEKSDHFYIQWTAVITIHHKAVWKIFIIQLPKKAELVFFIVFFVRSFFDYDFQ